MGSLVFVGTNSTQHVTDQLLYGRRTKKAER